MTDERLDPAAEPQASLPEVVQEVAPVVQDVAGPALAEPNRFATAGKLGAERVHRLIRLGQQYEQEHGLKRGRQRLRQLIQLGKRFEQEHGLAAPKRRRKRLSREDVWAEFVKALARVVKPAYRADVERLVGALRPAGEAPAAA
jgi:hypothetical protein